MTETDGLLEALDAFSRAWTRESENPNAAESPLLRFFKNPVKGEPLKVDQEALSDACSRFGLTGNADIPLLSALVHYRLRNEFETAARLIFRDLTAAHVRSADVLEGLLLTMAVGLSIITYMLAHLNERIPNERTGHPDEASSLSRLRHLQACLKDLQRIRLAYSKSGKARLLNVVPRDRETAAALGFPGLFDSADKVAELLSARHLAAAIRTAQTVS
ncbi:MAG: hypothetical protein ACI4SY_04220 [Sutterella sp.]